MMPTESASHHGKCTCGHVRYRMNGGPLFVHCCHCLWCQRETGTAFAYNALVEANRVVLVAGELEIIDTPSFSGKGQKISRCPRCRIAVWSNYAGAGNTMHFVRVGTLDDPHSMPPDIHIYTCTKQPWVQLPAGIPAVPEYYKASEYWPKASLDRRELLRARAGAR
ncbi:MAG: glutathione-dependent formaldehyde-activating [Gammaproteobacteria bacterium]|nr:glutathione-dependent formaldehyde-activating [Gammaproteobacteria bacterium]